ncbi:hypothetical protein BEH_07760 [Priestia filamentosa]|uniref:Uncharacterized protein n=1 Tax=Priestia filamentosa TaxID=1402861 RepID=A0A0H4KEG6_9BACI|nr:hypothetical protein [Priestia filamentosa]AKO92005.1 hypothetical protein BEH_07760 [Priestia filamentosa]
MGIRDVGSMEMFLIDNQTGETTKVETLNCKVDVASVGVENKNSQLIKDGDSFSFHSSGGWSMGLQNVELDDSWDNLVRTHPRFDATVSSIQLPKGKTKVPKKKRIQKKWKKRYGREVTYKNCVWGGDI